jgi:hypothetical protein
MLAYAAEPAVPSDDVRSRIVREIQSQTRLTAVPPRVVPLGQGLASAWPNVLRLAAVLAFVALMLGLVVLWRRDAASRREIAELVRISNRQQRELQIERDNVARQTEALTFLNSPDAKKMVLAGTTAAQTARATFMYDEKSRHAMLMIDGLPATPAGKSYEVWFIPKGQAPMPGRTFTVPSDGRALVADQIPMAAGSVMAVAITLEPTGGSTSPTMPIYLASPAS